jgi:hypothetical protein
MNCMELAQINFDGFNYLIQQDEMHVLWWTNAIQIKAMEKLNPMDEKLSLDDDGWISSIIAIRCWVVDK